MALGGAGQVGLFVAAQQVFERHQHQRGAGVADVADGGVDHGIVVWQWAVVGLQGAAQAGVFFLALLAPVQFGGGIDQLQAMAPVDVAVFQPAGQRGQVVRAGGGQGAVGPVENGFEVARLGLLEGQHAHAQHGLVGQLFAQALGHGAEVFAEDDRLVPNRFQRQQA
ncbi:hypothetical protein D3C81_1467990 [compost metagenome]